MKLKIEESAKYSEVEIDIRCPYVDLELESLINSIRQYSFSVSGKLKGAIHRIQADEIFYFESVDNRTFIYTDRDIYESDLKLYEVENSIKHTGFLRVSKSCILNAAKLQSIRPLLNGKFKATLKNGEMVIVSRHYTPALREHFGL